MVGATPPADAGWGAVAPAARPFVDVRQVRRAFSRAAASYDASAAIEREIGRRLLERLDCMTVAPKHIIDLGCGPGTASHALQARYPDAQLVGVDSAEPILRAGRQEGRWLRLLMPFLRQRGGGRVCADAAALPLAGGGSQFVWSNLMLPWVDDPMAVFREAHRVLAVEGLLMFSTLGPDSLKELRASFADGVTHTQRFIDMHDLGDMLVACGFADPVMEMEILTVTYPTVDALLGELRATGATCAMTSRRRGLTGRRAWQVMRDRYEALRRDGRLPATLEVIYGHAWKGTPTKTADGRSVVRLDFPKKP